MNFPGIDKLKEPASSRQVAIFLCLLGALLRFWDLGNYSITADELSVLDRIRFGSFSELILHGVVPDFHPAGVQVFMYYYCKLAGTGEWAIRFPFFLCGTLALPLIYLICRNWFGDVSAIFSLGICSVSQLFVVYSRLARPYAPGLFFCLLVVWFLQLILSEDKDRKLMGYAIAAALAMVAAMYTHYLAFFFVALTGISGLFLLGRKSRLYWMLSGLLASLLFVPHINLFILQTGYGGVGGPDGWLSVPDLSFFNDFTTYFFNHSLLIAFLIVTSIVLMSTFFATGKPSISGLMVCLIWGLLPPVFFYVYSIKVNPILQISGLIFSTPFLVFGFTSRMPRTFTLFHQWFSVILFSLISLITVYGKNFYARRFFGEYRALSAYAENADKVFGKGKITHTLNVESAFFGTYSLRHFSHPPEYVFYAIPQRDSLASFRKSVDNATTDYFSFAWSNLVNPYETLDLIREKYPCLVERRWLYNSEWYLFAKAGKGFSEDLPQLSFSVPCDSNVLLSEKNPYGPTFEKPVKDVYVSAGQIVTCMVDIMVNGTLQGTELVMEVKRGNEVVYWRSSSAKAFGLDSGKRRKIYFSSRIPPSVKQEDLIRFYLWQHDKAEVKIYQMQIHSFPGNPGLYDFTLNR
ncbi:MAG: glycosyltransferase family 39 protein [Bacteroidota bacterium]|jgi:4-amino-4-deoxy-L-arabinose transferase-like glycosyltransferase